MATARYEWPEEHSPLQELRAPLFEHCEVTVCIKRDDLLAPFGGNKGRKLKYAWKAFVEAGMRGLVTMGGPFSNHLYAFATLCRYYDVSGIALVRGEVTDMTNPVLKHLRDCGVELIALTRSEYARRYSSEFRHTIATRFPGHMFVPEGGAGQNGIRGCHELGKEILHQSKVTPDVVVVSAGTGTTAAGISMGVGPGTRVIAISALREKIIRPAFDQTLDLVGLSGELAPELNTDYHFGGFAKWDAGLIGFMRQFERDHGMLLDPLYTAKTVYAAFDMIGKSRFGKGSHIVVVHTGGMPGRLGFNYRFPGLLESLSQ